MNDVDQMRRAMVLGSAVAAVSVALRAANVATALVSEMTPSSSAPAAPGEPWRAKMDGQVRRGVFPTVSLEKRRS